MNLVCCTCSAIVEKYLLEKSRIVSQLNNERYCAEGGGGGLGGGYRGAGGEEHVGVTHGAQSQTVH